jgi:hypothetical protein
MGARWMVILLIVLTSCQYGLIPCPRVKGDRMKRSRAKLSYYSPRAVTASVEEKPSQDLRRRPDPKPAPLEHINVEEWDCPKPGQKKMPKAVKDNIRKNRKAYGSYYKSRTDSLVVNPNK